VHPLRYPWRVGSRYTVMVDPAWTNTGNVTLTLYDVVDQNASVTIGGSAATLTLTTPGQNAKVTFDGTAGQQATVHITSNTIGWTGVTLRNPDNDSMTSTWWFATNFDLQTQTLPTTGTYTIDVDPSWGATGSIAVSVTSP
jgi:hypothetical protein